MAQGFTGQNQEEATHLKPASFKKWFNALPPRFSTNEEGQGLVEYALILLLVAIVVISILIFMGPQIGSMFSAVSKGIS